MDKYTEIGDMVLIDGQHLTRPGFIMDVLKQMHLHPLVFPLKNLLN